MLIFSQYLPLKSELRVDSNPVGKGKIRVDSNPGLNGLSESFNVQFNSTGHKKYSIMNRIFGKLTRPLALVTVLNWDSKLSGF